MNSVRALIETLKNRLRPLTLIILILVLIVVVVIFILIVLGNHTQNVFSNISSAFGP